MASFIENFQFGSRLRVCNFLQGKGIKKFKGYIIFVLQRACIVNVKILEVAAYSNIQKLQGWHGVR